jgi:hypothetical protein
VVVGGQRVRGARGAAGGTRLRCSEGRRVRSCWCQYGAAPTSIAAPSELLGTTMKRRERGGVLSGSDGSSSCMGRGCNAVKVLQEDAAEQAY